MAKNEMTNVAEQFILPASVVDADKLRQAPLEYTLERVPYAKLYANFSRNIRIQKGTQLFGVEFKADTYEIASLVTGIIQVGYISEPLTVSRKMIDGIERDEILGGFRRYAAAGEIIAAGTNLNVIQELQQIPVKVYRNLTREQEANLVNDQKSKTFKSCEVLREVWRKLENGESWQLIGMTMSEQLERALGSHGKSSQLEAAKTQAEKLKVIQDWLNTSINQYWQSVHLYGGKRFKKELFLHYAGKDGLIGKDDEKAKIRWTAGLWQGKEGVIHAIRADIQAGKYDRTEGTGPETDKWFEETIKKQSEPKAKKSVGGDVAKPGDIIRGMANAETRSQPLREALESCLVNSPVHQLEQWDIKLNAWGKKSESFNAARGRLPANVLELLSMAFDSSASPDDFDAKLAAIVTEYQTAKNAAKAAEVVEPSAEVKEEASKPHGKKAKSHK